VLPVLRTKEQARQSYNRISRYYDFLAGIFERKYAKMALGGLSIREGESVLEIGFGTGYCLKRIAEQVGQTGKVYGIDISSGMMEMARRRLNKAGIAGRVELYCGDAASLPFNDNVFDAIFMSFTLELFDTPEIPRVLDQTKRVLKPGGRLAIASLSKGNGKLPLLRLYEWMHNKWPIYIDCRPIYPEKSVIDGGYRIKSKQKVKLFGLPGEIVIAVK
jgi:demethylmenaquinone methyltransferase/2-methoxy-6-polyprenyl-1,4-benzoquinol methylase